MLDLLRQIGEMLLQVVNSIWTLISWLPRIMSFAGGGAQNFLPTFLLPVMIVCCALYLAKLLLGGDNK